MLAEYGLLDMMGSRSPDRELLGAVLDLFNGHPVPALHRGAWHPAPLTSRRTAFAAHLLGVAFAGSYPFRGVPAGVCGCPPRQHSCDGLGTTYLCIDLDDKRGEGGMRDMVARTVGVCVEAELEPLTFTSRSGKGVHVYVFLDEAVTTAEAHAAGANLAEAAGVSARCDVLPSAGHATGFGTQHALPLSPRAEGGILLDGGQRPVIDRGRLLEALRLRHLRRSDARALRRLSGEPRGSRVSPGAQARGRNRPESAESGRKRPEAAGNRGHTASPQLLATLRAHHPQFRRALATPAHAWKGGRSAREAHLAAIMLRQGMRPADAAAALLRLPETKSAERGLAYARTLVEAAARRSADPVSRKAISGDRAGTARPPVRRATPWVNRHAPPLEYDGERNPWWEKDVQARLPTRTRKTDAVVLAYLIDRWFRGPWPRRTFFLGHRALAADLGFSSPAVGRSVKRLAKLLPDVLRVTPGVPHPTLRVATAYTVVGARCIDRVDWHLEPGQSHPDRVCYARVGRGEPDGEDGSPSYEGMASRDTRAGSIDGAAGRGESPRSVAHAVAAGL